MIAKVICVQVVSMLGYDMLFQDVDIIWYKNCSNTSGNSSSAMADYDIFFKTMADTVCGNAPIN
jgi:hypothetical protein